MERNLWVSFCSFNPIDSSKREGLSIRRFEEDCQDVGSPYLFTVSQPEGEA